MRHITKKKLAYTTIIFSLSTLAFVSVQSGTMSVKAATQATSINELRTVKNNKTVYIYSKPTTKSTKNTKLPKNSAVVVTGKTQNGFSQIRYAFSYAYVKTASLSKVSANNSLTSYARDTSKAYKYKNPDLAGSGYKQSFTASYLKKHKAAQSLKNFWYYNSAPGPLAFNEYDTSKGLYEGFIEDGYLTLAMKYPVKKNSTWTSYGKTSKVISTTKTVKTSAGTYKNVKVVTNNGYTSYYAPNKGLIKQSYTYKKKPVTNLILVK